MMDKFEKIVISAFVLIGIIIGTVFFILFTRKDNNQQIITNSPDIENAYDVLIYGTDADLNEPFEKLLLDYKNASGIVVKYENSSEISLEERMKNEKSAPDVFIIKKMDELRTQKKLENVFDFLNVTQSVFKNVCENIPENLKLGLSEINSCGIPLTVRGCGFAADPKIFAYIFGEGNYKSFANDICVCSYNEFEDFIRLSSAFISGNSPEPLNMQGKNYVFLEKNTNLNLKSVFSISSESPIFESMNSGLALILKSASDLACSVDIKNFFEPSKKFIRVFELISGNSKFGKSGDFVNLDVNSQKKAAKYFASGETILFLTDDTSFNDIKLYNPELAARMFYVPFKIPVEQDEIFSDLTAAKINSGLTCFCPYYLVINANSKKINESQDFLAWLKSSPAAERHLVENFGFLPYDVRDAEIIENKLARSAFSFMSSNKYLPPVFYGAPMKWRGKVLEEIKKYISNPNQDPANYGDFADFCLRKWEN
jgi:raffinose/stachyose/melibiose transport system substrate-binding protein